MRVAVAALLFALLGQSVFALVEAEDEDGRRAAPSATTPASGPAAPANSAPAVPTADALVAALPDAPPIPTAVKTVENMPSAPGPALGNEFLVNNSLAPIHALLVPPAAVIKLKPQPPRSHNFFDARNRLGFATLGASLTADALSTQKGLAYPGFHEMNPIARPFVQTRVGAAAYNAGSFGLLTGMMYWAHKKEHHKLERILPLAVGGWEGLLSFRNYRAIANRPR